MARLMDHGTISRWSPKAWKWAKVTRETDLKISKASWIKVSITFLSVSTKLGSKRRLRNCRSGRAVNSTPENERLRAKMPKYRSTSPNRANLRLKSIWSWLRQKPSSVGGLPRPRMGVWHRASKMLSSAATKKLRQVTSVESRQLRVEAATLH